MPDVFVAPEENKDTAIVHKRTPLPDTTTMAQQIGEEPVATPVHVPSLHTSEKGSMIPLLTSFWQNPRGVYFDTQEANEHILLFLRRHFITNVPWIFVTVILVFLPPVVSMLLNTTHSAITFLPGPFVFALVWMYYLVVGTNAFLHFLDWYYNISLITQRRVMDVELKDLVYKKISATKISLVQDINYVQSGTIRSIFDYGEVLIQTAGTQENFYVNSVPKPEVVVRVVESLIGKGREDNDNAPL